jgi:membrane protease YdiL (CAAX protease family)
MPRIVVGSPGRIAVHARLRAPDRPIGSAAGMPRTAAVPAAVRHGRSQEHVRAAAVFHRDRPTIMSSLQVTSSAPVSRPGKPWRVLGSPPTRIVVAAIPLLVLMAATDASIVVLGLVPGGVASSLIALAGGLVGVAVYVAYVRVIERRPLVELAARGAAGELARGLALGISLFAVTAGILVLIGMGRIERGDGVAAIAPWLLWVAGTAVFEEILFRGVVFRILEDWLGSWVALAISAALFGGLHAANAGASAGSTLAIAVEAGVLLGAAYMASGRLWLPIALHAGWNLAQLGLLGVQRPGHSTHGVWSSRFTGPTLLTGGDWGPEISLVAVALCLAAAVALLMAARRRRRPAVPGT